MTEREFNDKLQMAKVLFYERIKADIEKSATLANYVASKISNNNIYISGQLPKDLLDNNKVITGKAIDNNDIFEAKYASVMCAMQILFVLKNEIGDLSKIKSCIQLQVFVNSSPDFINQHLVANGASDFICEYFDKITDNKKISPHTRCAVGAATLPLGSLVEIGGIFEI